MTSYEEQNAIRIKKINKIKNFIDESSTSIDFSNKNIDFLFGIENNENYSIDDDTLTNINLYRDELIDKKYENIENQFNIFLNIKNNKDFFHDYFTKRIKKNKNIKILFQNSIEEKTINIKTNAFEYQIKDAVFKNLSGNRFFNKITKSVFENIDKKFNSDKIINRSFLSRDFNKKVVFSRTEDNIANIKLLTDSQIILEDNEISNFSKPLLTSTNGIIIQNFINFTRSLYTLSPGCFQKNYKNQNGTVFLYNDFENQSFLNYTTETFGLNVFESLIVNNAGRNKINYNTLLSELKEYESDTLNQINPVNSDVGKCDFYKPDASFNRNIDSRIFSDNNNYYSGNENLRITVLRNSLNETDALVSHLYNYYYSSYISNFKIIENIIDRNYLIKPSYKSISRENYDNIANSQMPESVLVTFFINSDRIFSESLYKIKLNDSSSEGNQIKNKIKFYGSDGNPFYVRDHLKFLDWYVQNTLNEGAPSDIGAAEILNRYGSEDNPDNGHLAQVAYNYKLQSPVTPISDLSIRSSYPSLNTINSNSVDIDGHVDIPYTQNGSPSNIQYFYSYDYSNLYNVYYKKELIFKNNIQTNFNKNNFTINTKFSLDNDININTLKYKTKLDNLIKSTKRNYLKNSNVSLNFSNEVINNIKNSDNNTIMLSYCNKDKEDEKLSVIDKDSEIFDFLFTKSEESEDIFSHYDLISDYKINDSNFLSYKKLIENNIEINASEEVFKQNFKNLLSLYYPENTFFTSTTLMNNILNSIIKEAKISNNVSENYEDIANTQNLYFEYFLDNESNLESKQIIAKRFLKKSIFIDDKISASHLSDKKLTDFIIKHEKVSIDSVDFTKENSVKLYLNKIIETSENLNVIRDSVFNIKNIRKISEKHDYRKIQNFVFRESSAEVWGEDLEGLVTIDGIMLHNIFPSYAFLFNFSCISDPAVNSLGDEISERLILENKNKINKIAEDLYEIDRNELDITEKDNIHVKVIPFANEKVHLRESRTRPYFILEDKFDIACQENNFVFNTICTTIQDYLRIKIKNYSENIFENEDDIDGFISENNSILTDISTIIELFSETYMIYFSRIQRASSLKIFTETPNRIKHSSILGGENNKFSLNGHIVKHRNINSLNSIFNNNFSQRSYTHDNVSFNEDFYFNTVSDINRFLEDFNENKTSYYQKEEPDLFRFDFQNKVLGDTKISYKLKTIMTSLLKSDLYQSFYFDFINALILYSDSLKEKEISILTSSESFEILKDFFSNESVESFENNFYNLFYINKISKLFENDEESQKDTQDMILTQTQDANSSIDFYDNNEVFIKYKEIEKKKINKEGFLHYQHASPETSLVSNETEDHINSSFYCFGLNNKAMSILSPQNVIKISACYIDNFNLNHHYQPKVFLFSPLLTGNILNKKIGIYNLNNNISNRIEYFDIDFLKSELDTESTAEITNVPLKLFVENVRKSFATFINKFVNENDKPEIDGETISNSLFKVKMTREIAAYIIDCHYYSSLNKKLTNLIYSISDLKNDNKDIIDINIYNKFKNTNKFDFYNIFDTKKENVINSFDLSFKDNHVKMPSNYESIKNKTHFFNVLKETNNVGNFSNIKSIEQENFYDTYLLAINLKGIKYLDTSGNTQSDPSLSYPSYTDIEKLLLNIDNPDSFEFFESYRLNENNILKNDNYNITFKVEII